MYWWFSEFEVLLFRLIVVWIMDSGKHWIEGEKFFYKIKWIYLIECQISIWRCRDSVELNFIYLKYIFIYLEHSRKKNKYEWKSIKKFLKCD